MQQPFWDMGGTLAEAPGSNPATASYRYFEPDEHGTPRVLRDQNKAMLAKFEYMPYGDPLSSAGVSSYMGYTGMWQSCNSGNSHFPLREYDPDIARWTTRDPLGMADGPNMHIYADGNPSSYFDPTGGSRLPVTKPPWWSPERVKTNLICTLFGIRHDNGNAIGLLQNDETIVGLIEGSVFAAVRAGTAHTVAARWMKKNAIGFCISVALRFFAGLGASACLNHDDQGHNSLTITGSWGGGVGVVGDGIVSLLLTNASSVDELNGVGWAGAGAFGGGVTIEGGIVQGTTYTGVFMGGGLGAGAACGGGVGVTIPIM